ncbi:MAG TPA: ankyrin repeat domain-containing protein [Chthonomonadaceae bacterium]|nr:ankyrin repeat domain-containing protein [Chthonomonadaceae bacterium]
MNKHTRHLMLVASLACTGSIALARPDKPFPDVPKDHWAYQAVMELKQKGILIGYPDGTFNDNGSREARLRYALVSAIRNNEVQTVQAALKAGANPNSRTLDVPDTRVFPVGVMQDWNIDSTPLMLCIAHAGDPTLPIRTVKGENGQTYLAYDDLALLKALLAAGADPNVPGEIATNMEAYPLECAIRRHRSIAFLRLLIQYGGRINQRSLTGETPVYYAAFADYPEAIELLLNQGADIMAHRWGGETPLHCACRCLHLASVETLLRHHAFINARNNEGKTPLDYALTESDRWLVVDDFHKSLQLEYNAERRKKIVPILRKAGAKTGQELSSQSANPSKR